MLRLNLAAYAFPNDDMESDRLDLQYEALKTIHNDKIYFAPLKDPKRILDIGTGTGTWPIEMGECSAIFPSNCASVVEKEASLVGRLTDFPSGTFSERSYHRNRSFPDPTFSSPTKSEL
jgi:hypothetical protein